jgi:ABC-type phosphate/phosphonate transport system substrate-binding protein
MGPKVGFEIKCELYDGQTADDLLKFGKRLTDPNDLGAHLGGMWGLEYGWLLKENLDLEPVALFQHGDSETTLHCLLIARRDKGFQSLKELKGMRLATYDSASLMVERGLAELFEAKQLEQKGFFVLPKKAFNGVKDALFAVRRGDADCVMVTESDFKRLEAIQPEVQKSLAMVERSAPFPLAALVGSRQKINALKKGLWEAMMREFSKLDEKQEGRRCVSFWRFNQFVVPPDKYRDQVLARAATMPFREQK